MLKLIFRHSAYHKFMYLLDQHLPFVQDLSSAASLKSEYKRIELNRGSHVISVKPGMYLEWNFSFVSAHVMQYFYTYYSLPAP